MSAVAELIERLRSHMGKQDVPVLLADCRLAADALEATEARAEELEKVLATADYLIDRYRKVHSGKPVRDLDEAEEAYRCARALSHTLTEEGSK